MGKVRKHMDSGLANRDSQVSAVWKLYEELGMFSLGGGAVWQHNCLFKIPKEM